MLDAADEAPVRLDDLWPTQDQDLSWPPYLRVTVEVGSQDIKANMGTGTTGQTCRSLRRERSPSISLRATSAISHVAAGRLRSGSQAPCRPSAWSSCAATQEDFAHPVGQVGPFIEGIVEPELDRAREFLGVAEVECMGCLLDERHGQMCGAESGDLADACRRCHEWVAPTQDGKGRDRGVYQAFERRGARRLAKEAQPVQRSEPDVVRHCNGEHPRALTNAVPRELAQ